jgi:hypothetical protein
LGSGIDNGGGVLIAGYWRRRLAWDKGQGSKKPTRTEKAPQAGWDFKQSIWTFFIIRPFEMTKESGSTAQYHGAY